MDGAEQEAVKKHPLQFRWVLWHDHARSKQTIKNWDANLNKIATFDTVEDFWALFNNILEPSRLDVGSAYHLFKEGIMPKWEDPANDKGGKWVMQSSSQRRGKMFDGIWITTVMTLIGEGFDAEQSDDICGIVCNVRKSNDKISIWTKTAMNRGLTEAIGRKWKEVAVGKANLSYMVHKESMAKGKSFGNAGKYVL